LSWSFLVFVLVVVCWFWFCFVLIKENPDHHHCWDLQQRPIFPPLWKDERWN